MIRRRPLTFAALAAGVLLAVYGGQAQTKSPPVPAADYIDAHSVDLVRLLPPSPSNDSAVTRADIEELLRVQASRTPDDCARAATDRDVTLPRFATALGLTSATQDRDLPKTTTLVERVRRIELTVVSRAKKAYARPRPFELDPRIQPCILRPTNEAYPSGHSAWAYATALVLADLVPERRQQLLERAADYARQRVVGGVHYPSDVEAGRMSGTVLAALLFASPAYQADAAQARSELRAALGLPQQP